MSEPTVHIDEALVRRLQLRHIPASQPLDSWPGSPVPILTSELADVCGVTLARILGEPGFAVVDLPSEGLEDEALCSAAWNLFTALCTPVPQYRTGELIYPVEVSSMAEGVSHYSTSNTSGGFHTDGTLLPRPPEIAALFGLSPADAGGETVLMDGPALCAQLDALDLRHVEVLSRSHYFDLMGQAIGADTKRQPIVTRVDGRFEMRYLRYYIEQGYEKAGRPVPLDLQAAMDALDTLAADEGNQIPTLLGRGDLLLWNNHRFLHGRRVFTEGLSRRRLRRMYGMHSMERPAAASA